MPAAFGHWKRGRAVPDLGTYAVEVLSAYAVSIALLVGVVGLSWRRYVRVRAALEQAEKND